MYVCENLNQEKKIDYAKALEKYENDKNLAFAAYLKSQEEAEKNFSVEKLKKAQEEYYMLQKIAYERYFRQKDNEAQAKKGIDGSYFGKTQISLDDEDTCVQFHNDPV